MKIVYITNGMASTLHCSFELVRRLRRAGHEVTYLSPADIAAQVSAQGHPFHHLTADRSFQQRVAGDPPFWHTLPRPLQAIRWLRRRRRIRRESAANDEIETLVRRLAPDLLLIDIEMHFAILATAGLGIPILLPIVWYSLFRQPGLPPLHTDLQPGRSAARRFSIALAWWRLRFSTFRLAWRQRLERWWRGDQLPPVPYDTFSLDDLRYLARHKGFPFRRETSHAHWLRPYMYRRLPVLCMNAREMDFPQPPHPNNHYVGPMIDRRRKEALLDSESGHAWHRFQQQRQGAGRPLIYCSLGTFWSADVPFLRRVVEVFARRPEWDLVLGLGGKLEPEALAPLPDNVLAVAWAPQLEVLEVADCAITHGGITTINECVELRVPMVVYSTRHVDQNGCATRIAYHRLGIVADKDRDGPRQLEQNIEQALGDPAIRENLEAMYQVFKDYEETDQAVRLIEGMAR